MGLDYCLHFNKGFFNGRCPDDLPDMVPHGRTG